VSDTRRELLDGERGEGPKCQHDWDKDREETVGNRVFGVIRCHLCGEEKKVQIDTVTMRKEMAACRRYRRGR